MWWTRAWTSWISFFQKSIFCANWGRFTELEGNLKSTIYQKFHSLMASEVAPKNVWKCKIKFSYQTLWGFLRESHDIPTSQVASCHASPSPSHGWGLPLGRHDEWHAGRWELQTNFVQSSPGNPKKGTPAKPWKKNRKTCVNATSETNAVRFHT